MWFVSVYCHIHYFFLHTLFLNVFYFYIYFVLCVVKQLPFKEMKKQEKENILCSPHAHRLCHPHAFAEIRVSVWCLSPKSSL